MWISHLSPPQPSLDLALFIDFDGTLVDIAASPDQIIVPSELPLLLVSLHKILQGALAIVSGRRLIDLKNYLEPAEVTIVAEHGAVIHMAGKIEVQSIPSWPVSWRSSLEEFVRRWPGVEIEEKTFGVVIHFRNAPSAEKAAHDIVHALANASEGDYQVTSAKMAYELRRPGINKGAAVRSLMLTPAFNTRIPVFIGDDVTDHDGFAAATAAGGMALDVATVFDDKPALVREWLESFTTLQPATR